MYVEFSKRMLKVLDLLFELFVIDVKWSHWLFFIKLRVPSKLLFETLVITLEMDLHYFFLILQFAHAETIVTGLECNLGCV